MSDTSLDFTELRSFVDHYDITEDQKAELLAAVVQIARHFVDLAWGTEAMQLCLGQKDYEDVFEASRDVNSNDHDLKSTFAVAAGDRGEKGAS